MGGIQSRAPQWAAVLIRCANGSWPKAMHGARERQPWSHIVAREEIEGLRRQVGAEVQRDVVEVEEADDRRRGARQADAIQA